MPRRPASRGGRPDEAAGEALPKDLQPPAAPPASRNPSEELFRRLVESTTDYAIFRLDPDGRVATWNLGAERIKGYRADEIIGRHFSLFYPAEALASGWPQHELEVAAAEGRFEDEGWRIRKDGSRFWANVVLTALMQDGRLVGFSKVTRDLTERKLAEEELRQARDRLEERVVQRTAELTSANAELLRLDRELRQTIAELAAADRRKNEFLATLAHELRNPLAPLRNALQILELADDVPETRREARRMMERQLAQLVRLIDDLLDVARITSNKLQLRRERIDLAAAVHDALESTRQLIAAAGHELAVELPAEPVLLDADQTRLAQVFTNLLNNAAKYTDRGGRIVLTAERQGGEAVVTVRDSGIGITAEHMPHLFEIFSQAAPPLERSQGGLGIGLSLVRGLVELHGGRVEARSEGPGRGSELIVRLPLEETAKPAPATPPATERTQPAARLRVLIADDNQDAADSLSLLLLLRGYEVRTVHDGAAALAEAESFRPHVALLDIGMPRLNGYQAALRLREQPWGADLVLVAITGWGQDEDRQRAHAAGFNHHLTKPVDPDELFRLLDGASRRERAPAG
jgi:PAS domain S-box-containing protein